MQQPQNAAKGSVRRHRNGWQVRVYAGRVDGQSKFLTRTVHGSEAAALRVAEELAAGVADSRRRNGGQRSRATVGGYFPTWADRLVPIGGYARSTARAWTAKLGRWVIPALADRELDAVMPADIEKLYTAMAAADVSANYRRDVHTALVRFFKDAEREGLVAMSPMPYVQRPKAVRRRPVAPEADEVIDYLDAAKDYGDGDFGVLLVLAFATGARRGELVGLQWRDINFDRGDVFIRRTVDGERNDDLEVKELKTGEAGEGRVPVDDHTLGVLRRYKLAREETALAAGTRVKRTSYLFSQDPLGVTPRRPHWATRAMQRVKDLNRLEPVSVQGMRRASATVPLDDGVPAAVVAGRLRHDPETMAKHYAGRSRRGRDAAVAALGAVVAEAIGGQS